MHKREEDTLRNYIREESVRKIFAKVFDDHAVQAIHSLASKGLFDVVEFIVSTGKEAHVFRARDTSGNFRAVKIYKISTSDFRNMNKYIEGDERFKAIKRDKKSVVFAWTQKEFKNLEVAVKAGVRVPMPAGFKDNVLVMEFIGEKGVAAKTLKEVGLKNSLFTPEEAYEIFIEWMAKLYKANLIHADLSEYNVLVNGEELVLIDIGQAVLRSHPNAREFFERDVKNVAIYFSKNGLEKSAEEVYADVKKAIGEKA
ncbi:MAG: serine protein kinase RIO [Candidatus Diapherotrites archaeon]